MIGEKIPRGPEQKPAQKEKLENEPDAWNRFENAVHKIIPPKKVKKKAEIRGTKND